MGAKVELVWLVVSDDPWALDLLVLLSLELSSQLAEVGDDILGRDSLGDSEGAILGLD